MPTPEPADATLAAVISRAVSDAGYWLPGPGCEAAAKTVTARAQAELEASQRRAIRIQSLLDEQRDRIRKLHQPVEHMGRIICAECSAYCGESTDNPPTPMPCPTIAALEPTA